MQCQRVRGGEIYGKNLHFAYFKDLLVVMVVMTWNEDHQYSEKTSIKGDYIAELSEFEVNQCL